MNELQRHTQVAILGQAVVGLPHQELSEAAADADLTVLRAPGAHPLTEWLLGAHPGRVLRHCQSPVLVVRQPASVGYRRVLAAIAFDGGAAGVIAVACGMMGGPVREVLNALVAQPELVRRGAGRDGILAARRLRAVVQQVMIDNDGARRVFGAPSIALNHSPEMLLKKERAVFAELLVFAPPRPADGARDGWFPQGDAQRLLAATASDVLLLPAGPLGTSATTP